MGIAARPSWSRRCSPDRATAADEPQCPRHGRRELADRRAHRRRAPPAPPRRLRFASRTSRPTTARRQVPTSTSPGASRQACCCSKVVSVDYFGNRAEGLGCRAGQQPRKGPPCAASGAFAGALRHDQGCRHSGRLRQYAVGARRWRRAAGSRCWRSTCRGDADADTLFNRIKYIDGAELSTAWRRIPIWIHDACRQQR